MGAISLVVLAIAVPARYFKDLAGAWRKAYARNCFDCALPERLCVGRAALHESAFPACTRTHGIRAAFLNQPSRLDGIFIVLTTLTIAATIRFHPEAVHAS